MRSRWVVEVVGPSHESIRDAESLKEYAFSPIRDGEFYYCEFYNGTWHLDDGTGFKSCVFYLSGKVGPVEHHESANDYVERHFASERPAMSRVFEVALDLNGKKLKGGGCGNEYAVVAHLGLLERFGLGVERPSELLVMTGHAPVLRRPGAIR
jgi:hypothetical protein